MHSLVVTVFFFLKDFFWNFLFYFVEDVFAVDDDEERVTFHCCAVALTVSDGNIVRR